MFETKHGGAGTKLYRVWKGMKRRCKNESRSDYERYGGRGIYVCKEWEDDFSAFRDWSMNNGYTEELTLDRRDVNGSYTPDNCRWTDDETQRNNTRRNVFVTIEGDTKTLAQWARVVGVTTSTMHTRYNEGLRGIELIADRKTTMLGKQHTEETKRRISEKLKGENNHNYGKEFSEETRKRLSESHKGQKAHNKIEFTKEQINDIVARLKGKQSQEDIAKVYGCSRKPIYRIKQEFLRG